MDHEWANHLHKKIALSSAEKDCLRRLAERISEIAALPIHKEKAQLWRRLNDLEPTRPLVWVTEEPWHELNVNDELTLVCHAPWARDLEQSLRRTIYSWTHYPCDFVVNNFIESPLAINSTGFGITEDVDIARTDQVSSVVSRHFNLQITEPEDIEKIKMPIVTHDQATSESRFQTMLDIFGDIIPVQKLGVPSIWFTPWDSLIRWWGVQEAMMDLALRPEMVHAAVDRMVDASMAELDQLCELNLLSPNNCNVRVGSGGYGYTSALPGDNFDPSRLQPKNMWGCSNAQIFSSVSPEMHWEFAVKHDMRWLERWGMTYYGCCEPLDQKMDVLRRIPNLRKISVSAWCDPARAAGEIGTDYVISHKPNPAILAEDTWRPEQARRELSDALEKFRGCHVEVILKDISTCRYQPERLWEWVEITMEEVRRFENQ